MTDKSSDAFRSIGEVASELAIPQHVLRFWETRFPQVRPLKRGGGRRYYRPEDVALLHGIRFLLYSKGFTIKGVQRLLREQGVRFVAATASGDLMVDPAPPAESEPAASAPASPLQTDLPDDIQLTARQAFDQGAPSEPEPARSTETERRMGIGALLRGRHSDANQEPGGLSPQQSERLQEVILELLECKRLLDQVR